MIKIKFILLLIIIFPFCFAQESFLLKKLSYSCDVKFEEVEFLYLTGLCEGDIVSEQDLFIAKQNLQAKGRFLRVKIKEKKMDKGKSVHFSLVANWILKKLVIKKILFGKHSYSSHYKMQPGDFFDILLHEKAVENIKQMLMDDGYLNCSVYDELVYDKKNKTISAYITVKKNKKFFVKNISFNLESKGLSDDVFQSFNKYFKSEINKKLKKKTYKKEKTAKYARRIINFFKLQGFVSPKVSVKKKIYRNDNFLNFDFNILLGKNQKLEFIGNKLFTSKYIKENLLGLDYPSWFFTPEIVAQELLNFYHKRGYWDSVIFYSKRKDGSFLFNIKEGEPVFVKEILIKDENNSLFQSKELFLKNLENKLFNEDLLDEFINKLVQVYLKNGFWDFKVLSKDFKRRKTKNTCDIIMNVKKGKPRFINGFAVDAGSYFNKKEFLEKYQILNYEKKLIPFDFGLLQEQRQYILKKMQKVGYWYAQVFANLKEELIDNKLNVFVNWKIFPGKQIKFGTVFLKGDTKVPFKTILSELDFEKDSVWDAEKVEKARKNFKKLDIFKIVKFELDPIAISNKEETIPVKLTLSDSDPVTAAFRFGYFLTNKNFIFKRASTYRFGTALIFKNPTNNLDKLTLEADFTRFERKFDLEYKILSPFGLKFNGSRLIGKAKIYANKFINPVAVRVSESAYQATENGFLVSFNNEFKRDYYWRTVLGNEWIKTERVRGNINLDDNFINRTLPYFFINPTFIIKKVNDELDIKSGSITFASLKFMIPEYTGKPSAKVMLEQSFFKSIFEKVVLAVRFRLGHILNSDFSTIQPSQRFFLGGPYSVRGYDKDALPPYGMQEYLDDNGVLQKSYSVQGGRGMFNSNIELRFPIYKKFRGVIFQDVGVLSQTGLAGFLGKWFPSTGFGFRYKTPFGPIRFDLGFKWKSVLPDDIRYGWYLTFGEAF